MEFKKPIKSDPDKNVTLAKKESTSSSSEALTEMVFLPSSDYNRFSSLITDLRQDTMKGNNKYPRTVTNKYDMLKSFKLAEPRHNHIDHTGDKGNMENRGGCGGREHTFLQHTTPSGTVFVPGLIIHTSYHIKCFNGENWGYYENQCPEITRDRTPKNSGKIWHKSGGVLHKAVVVV